MRDHIFGRRLTRAPCDADDFAAPVLPCMRGQALHRAHRVVHLDRFWPDRFWPDRFWNVTIYNGNRLFRQHLRYKLTPAPDGEKNVTGFHRARVDAPARRIALTGPFGVHPAKNLLHGDAHQAFPYPKPSSTARATSRSSK